VCTHWSSGVWGVSGSYPPLYSTVCRSLVIISSCHCTSCVRLRSLLSSRPLWPAPTPYYLTHQTFQHQSCRTTRTPPFAQLAQILISTPSQNSILKEIGVLPSWSYRHPQKKYDQCGIIPPRGLHTTHGTLVNSPTLIRVPEYSRLYLARGK
jgi:hypothetical protein